jgi:hypothetical protein
MDAYDAGKVKQAKEQEDIRNNQQRLFTMEMDQVRAGYEARIKDLQASNAKEVDSIKSNHAQIVKAMKANQDREVAALILRYNPVIGEPGLKRLLEEAVDARPLRASQPGAFKATLEQEGVITRTEYAGFERQQRDYDRIVELLRAIPYRNSVPAIIAQVEYRNRLLANTYERLWNRLAETVDGKNAVIRSRNEELSQLTFALDYMISTSSENGFILDPRGLVFRRDDEYIGKIRFFRKDGKFRAALTELAAAANPLKPFDKVLIKEQ